MAKITGILVDVWKNDISVVTIEDELAEYYRIINCDCFDIASRQIGGKYFEFVCDDEGLLKEKVRPSAFNDDGKAMLVGNLFICNHEGPELTSLTEEDIQHIQKYRRVVITPDGINVCITGVEY